MPQRSVLVLAAVAVIPLLGSCATKRGSGAAITPGDHFAEVDGVRIRYHVHGAGPPILVHPGGPGVTAAYLRMPELERHFTLVYLDPVGTGESGRLGPGQYTLARYASDLDGLRAALALEKAWVLGHSYGGIVAQVWASSYPGRAKGLLLVATTPRIDADWSRDMESHLEGYSGEPWYAGAMAGMAEMGKATDDVSFTAAMRKVILFGFADYTHRRAEFEPVIARYEGTLGPNVPPPDGGNSPFDLRSRIGSIQAPTLILVGRHDFNCGPTYAEEIRRGIAGAQIVTFEKSGHMPQVEETEAFVNAIRRFVAQNP
jgi:proline iminopeptidase